MTRLRKLSLVSFLRSAILFIGFALLFLNAFNFLTQAAMKSLPAGLSAEGIYPKILGIRWVEWSKLPAEALLVLGWLGLSVPCFYLYLSNVEKRLRRGIVGKGTDGEDICLTPEAVERTVVREVRGAVMEVLEIRHCQVEQGKLGARVFIDLTVTERSPVPEVRKKVGVTVRSTLKRLIGYEDGSEIRVRVSHIASGGGLPGRRRNGRRPPPTETEIAREPDGIAP